MRPTVAAQEGRRGAAPPGRGQDQPGRRHLLRRHLWQNAASLGDLACATGLAWTAAARARAPGLEQPAAAAASAALFCNFLGTLVPFKRVGVLVITVLNMLSGDLFHFVVRRGAAGGITAKRAFR